MRLGRLDLLRGLASLSVVLFHYAAFFVDPGQAAVGVIAQPWRAALWPFYDHGGLAVQFFWILSGIVFMRVYAPIADTVTATDFALRRFARLYPLHLITLLLMAGFNGVNLAIFGQPLLPTNDAYHFVLQLFLASDWGFEAGHSFNFPIWSVSMEIVAMRSSSWS